MSSIRDDLSASPYQNSISKSSASTLSPESIADVLSPQNDNKITSASNNNSKNINNINNNNNNSNNNNNNNNSRATSACDRCRKRKSKCTGSRPCEYCSKHKLECTYTYVKKKRYVTKKPKPVVISQEGANLNPDNDVYLKTEENRDGDARIDRLISMNEMLWNKVNELSDKVDTLLSNTGFNSHGGSESSRQRTQSHGESNSVRLGDYKGALAEPVFDVVDETMSKYTCDKLVELVSSVCSSSMFSDGAINWIKEKAGKNYTLFQPVLDIYVCFLQNLARTIKIEFKDLEAQEEAICESPELVKYFAKLFLELPTKDFLISNAEVNDLFYRFITINAKKNSVDGKKVKPLLDSEKLLVCSIICLGCTLVGSKLQTASKTKPKSGKSDTLEISQHTVNFEKQAKLFLSLENRAMKSCFYYLLKIPTKTSSRYTVLGLIFLYLYLNTTIFSKFNYFVFNYLISNVRAMGYDNLPTNPMLRNDGMYWSKKLIWTKCYAFDKDVFTSLERPFLIGDKQLAEQDFFNMARFFLNQYLSLKGIDPKDNKEWEILNRINISEDGLIADKKDFYFILHKFASYDYSGFFLLCNFYSFQLSKIVFAFNHDIYLKNYSVIKKDNKLPKDFKHLAGQVLESFDKIEAMDHSSREWEMMLPVNIRPGKPLDISMYQTDSAKSFMDQYLSGSQKKRAREEDDMDWSVPDENWINDCDVNVLYNGHDLESFEFKSAVSVSNVVIHQFRYHYNLILSHRSAENACLNILKDEKLVSSIAKLNGYDVDRLKSSLTVRAKDYRESKLKAARNILVLINDLDSDIYHTLFWTMNFMNAAYSAIFMECLEIVGDKIEPLQLNEKLRDIHLMIDCYNNCLTNFFSPGKRVRQEMKDVFNRRLIILCIAHVKDHSDYKFDDDEKVQTFLSSINGTKDDTILELFNWYNKYSQDEKKLKTLFDNEKSLKHSLLEDPNLNIVSEPFFNTMNQGLIKRPWNGDSINSVRHSTSDVRGGVQKTDEDYNMFLQKQGLNESVPKMKKATSEFIEDIESQTLWNTEFESCIPSFQQTFVSISNCSSGEPQYSLNENIGMGGAAMGVANMGTPVGEPFSISVANTGVATSVPGNTPETPAYSKVYNSHMPSQMPPSSAQQAQQPMMFNDVYSGFDMSGQTNGFFNHDANSNSNGNGFQNGPNDFNNGTYGKGGTGNLMLNLLELDPLCLSDSLRTR